jgi:glycosyltransferase involved in cell wall biosynthesis
MKKILISTDFYKPGYRGGGPIQSIYNLSELISKDYIVKIVTRNYDLMQKENPYNIKTNKWIPQSENCNVKYLKENSFKTCFINTLSKEKPDFVYVNSFFSSSSQIHVLQTKLYNLFHEKKINIVIAPRGEFDPGALNSKGKINLKTTKKKVFVFFHKIFFGKKQRFQATAVLEKQNISKIFSRAQIFVAQNVPKLPEEYIEKEKKEDNTNFLYLGRISQKKNLLFALKSFQNLNINGKIVFNIVGPIIDKDYWNECINLFDILPSNVKCVYKGEINNNEIKNLCKENHYLYFPTLGENYGHVVYESLVHGLPVLISDNTPWIGKKNNNGIFANSLDNMNDFIEDIRYLHHLSPKSYKTLSKTAYKTAVDSANFSELLNEYNKLFS